MTKLAKEFGLSDVALHKICRKHGVPTPPAGHWAKKAYGKRVTTKPLPNPSNRTEIVIRESSASNEPEAIAEARIAMAAVVEAATVAETVPNSIVDRTIAKLGKIRRGTDGLVHSSGDTFVRIAVRPESIDRASNLLRDFVGAGERSGLKLVKHDGGAAWLCDGETIEFEIVEVADQVEHLASQKELDAVAKWKRERAETHRRFGYWQDWGEPKIPKWEKQFRGRLAVKLEKVRIETERSPWGDTIIGTFADSRTREVTKVIPRILATIAAMAAAKKANRVFEARRRAAAEEARRQWAEQERRRLEDQKAAALLEQLLSEKSSAERLRSFLNGLRSIDCPSQRLAAFVRWAEERLRRIEGGLAAARLDERIAEAGLFESAEAGARAAPVDSTSRLGSAEPVSV